MIAAIAPDMNLFIKHFLHGWVLDLTHCDRAISGGSCRTNRGQIVASELDAEI